MKLEYDGKQAIGRPTSVRSVMKPYIQESGEKYFLTVATTDG